MLTGILGSRRRRQSHDNQGQQQLTRMAASGAQLYSDLAASSGGQAIKVSKSQLLEAVTIITESSSSSLVITQGTLGQ